MHPWPRNISTMIMCFYNSHDACVPEHSCIDHVCVLGIEKLDYPKIYPHMLIAQDPCEIRPDV